MRRFPRELAQALVVVAGLLVAGAVGGVVWQWVWTAPIGVVIDHHWVQDEVGLRGDFAGTGTYVLVGAVAGLVAGLTAAIASRRHEVVTLAAVVLGSLAAAWLMYRVGAALGPADPRELARTAAQGTRLPGVLRVSGTSPFLALPSGALTGLAVVFIGLAGRHRRHPTATPGG